MCDDSSPRSVRTFLNNGFVLYLALNLSLSLIDGGGVAVSKRLKVVRELEQTESRYISSMRLLVKLFIEPLEAVTHATFS